MSCLHVVSNPYPTEDISCEFGSSKYYALCGFGGILSCGITHTAVVPLDLVKCRLQVGMRCQTTAQPSTRRRRHLRAMAAARVLIFRSSARMQPGWLHAYKAFAFLSAKIGSVYFSINWRKSKWVSTQLLRLIEPKKEKSVFTSKKVLLVEVLTFDL